ncbi:MAG: hypothetical protein ABEI98_11730 [Halorhabdus sp.]
MSSRRTFLRTVGGIAGVGLVGLGTATDGQLTDASDDGGLVAQTDRIAATGPAVEFVRNVEEVRGHLTSSMALLERGRREATALHAGHGTDYFGPILPHVCNRDPELATQLRARIKGVAARAESANADAFREYVTQQVFPLLDRAVETVVAGDLRNTTAFSVRVMNALAGRIADEYSAAVTADGTIEKEGEYWHGRGFLVWIEHRHGDVASALGDAGSGSLGRLRSEMESVAPPSSVLGTAVRFRIETAAGAGLPSVSVEGREDALRYVRNAEEVRGHLHSSVELAAVGDSTAGLHAGHGSDYLTTLLPPVQRADPELATRLFDRIRALDDRANSLSAGEFESYVTEDVLPLVDRAVATAVPDGITDDTSFDAAVLLALSDRVADEYSAAVTEDEVIELYGEYWDARGFLTRMEERFADFASDLDGDTRAEVDEELGILRRELETARPPRDVEGSVEALHEMLGGVADA